MAMITATLAAGSTESPYYYDVRITEKLCCKTSSTPVFVPNFKLLTYANVGSSQYEAIVSVEGIVTYTPCGKCCGKVQTVNHQFVLPFYSTVAPSGVSVVGGNAINALVKNGGCKDCCSNVMMCDVPVTLSVTTA